MKETRYKLGLEWPGFMVAIIGLIIAVYLYPPAGLGLSIGGVLYFSYLRKFTK